MKLVSVFRSPKREEMYLYVDKQEQLQRIPESLLDIFGQPEAVMDIPLTSKRKLARVETEEVLRQIAIQGYYLQMPPPREEYMLDPNDLPERGLR